MIDIAHYHIPHSLDDALSLLSPNDRPIAGGTDIVVKAHALRPALHSLVDLSHIPELKGIRQENGDLIVGAATTHANICASSLVRKHSPLLAEIAGQVGSIQIQNSGTVGGNLANASPAADVALGLLALHARVHAIGPQGPRVIPIEQLFAAPGLTSLAPNEILLEIHILSEWAGHPAAFLKIGRRKAHPIAVAAVAAVLDFTKEGSCQRASIALGAVAPTPIRAHTAEQYLEGAVLSEDRIARAARAAAAECSPIDDIRASADYRRNMIDVLTRRVIHHAASRTNT